MVPAKNAGRVSHDHPRMQMDVIPADVAGADRLDAGNGDDLFADLVADVAADEVRLGLLTARWISASLGKRLSATITWAAVLRLLQTLLMRYLYLTETFG